MTMKKREVALITIQPEYGFGSSDSQQESAIVPANSTLCYEVEMVSFVKVSLRHYFSPVYMLFYPRVGDNL